MWEYHQTIPNRYLASTVIPGYPFLIVRPSRWLFDRVETSAGQVQMISPSAHCLLRVHNGHVPLLIPVKSHEILAETIFELGSVSINGHRPTKYLNLYRAYEGLEKKPDVRFAALRHALAHNAKVLSHRKTVETLSALFGGTEINLWSSVRHERVFWQLYGELIVAIDGILGSILTARKNDFIMPAEYRKVIRAY